MRPVFAPADDHPAMTFPKFFFAGLALLASFVCPGLAQPAATGTIEGRVFNETSGSFLRSARVTLEGTNREAFTDQFGFYLLADVPAGPARIRVFYTGLPEQKATVN